MTTTDPTTTIAASLAANLAWLTEISAEARRDSRTVTFAAPWQR